MNSNLSKLFQDESEDAILARIQEESLRYYNEVELPRRAAEEVGGNLQQNEVGSKTEEVEPKAHCSKIITDNNSQVTPVKNVFFKGSNDGAEGFHLAAGETYVYPTNYPIRKYQKSIVHSALFHNTLVSLPTGLGKTFIAAVVMYNYYRWFPQGKIVFMAPTRPLVAQQIRACHDIMAIPIQDTVEMTGTMNPVDRLQQWKNRRVFFLTPQVMANDLRSGVCPAKSFKCVVIDEAHRATKEYSYCHVIKELEKAGAIFRVLALSATPGSNVKTVAEVVQNLRISTLELKGEDSPDVMPYTHAKKIEPVPLALSKSILDFMEQFLIIFERYAKSLREARLITCNVRNLTKFQLLKASEKIRSRPPNGISKSKLGMLMSDFGVCMTLAHGLDLLQSYGLRAFQQYFTGCEDEENRKAAFTRLNQDVEFHRLLDNLNNTVSSPMDKVWSHPKHEHLVKILKDHFCQAEEQKSDSKVIIFCQYRVVVSELYELLQKVHQLIKPVMFIGQGMGKDKSGLPQKKQIEVMRQFREGRSNVLIATCVAEEGLDIGSVDLLVLMEVQRSPVRLVQRLGRTGRHRSGRCVVLLTQGKEVQKFNEAMATRKSFLSSIQKSKHLSDCLYKEEPTMMPAHIMPKIQLVHVNVPERITPGKSKKQTDIRHALLSKLNDTEELPVVESPFISPEEEAMIKKELNTNIILGDELKIKNSDFLFPRINEAAMSSEELFSPALCQYSELNDWNRFLHQTYLLSHSCDAELLCHMLSKAESMLLGHDTDLNSQVDLNSVKFIKKKCTKSKETIDNYGKKKKTGKEGNKGMDIRYCMAVAADKARLAQDENIDNKKLSPILVSEPIDLDITITDIQDPTSFIDQKDSVGINSKDKVRNNCSLCGRLPISRYLKPQDNKLALFTENNWFAAEEFVKNITKNMIERINVDNIVKKSGFIMNDIKKSILVIRNNYVTDKLQCGKQCMAAIIESQTPTKATSLNTSAKETTFETRTTEILQNDKLDAVSKEEYFDLEDLFNDDNDELVFFDLDSNNLTSTPISKARANKRDMLVETNSTNIKTNDTESIIKDQINNAKLEGNCISSSVLPSGSSNKNVFKMPQIKLNLQTLKSSHSVVNSLYSKNINNGSPDSPILSGQTSSSPTTVSKFGRKVLFPDDIAKNSHFDVIHSPESPILSGQIPLKPDCLPKLERKILFEIVEKKENECSLLECKSLDSEILDEQLNSSAVDEDNLLSVSQLFDDDSNEKTNRNNLEQSSLYTISQMVAKVSTMAKTEPINPTPEVNDTINKSNNFKFGSSDDDTLFENFDLDALSKGNNFAPPIGKPGINEKTDKISKQTLLKNNGSRNEFLSAHYDTLTLLEDRTLPKFSNHSTNQISFSSLSRVSSVKSPALGHICNMKTSTPHIIEKSTDHLTDSDSNSDVFQSVAVKRKKPLPVNKVLKKENKPNLFLELEADVTGPLCSSDEENTSGLDELDESFINDLTEHPSTSLNHTILDMQARYLQSVRSPVKKPGGFKIPAVSESAMARDIFSQAIEEDDDSYENDSFCCDATEVPIDDNPSILELAEQLLDREQKSRKEKKKGNRYFSSFLESSVNNDKSFKKCSKRKRLISSGSSSDNNNDNSKTSKNLKKQKYKSFVDSDFSFVDDPIKAKNPCKRKRNAHLLTSGSSDSSLENVKRLNKKKRTVLLHSDSDSTN